MIDPESGFDMEDPEVEIWIEFISEIITHTEMGSKGEAGPKVSIQTFPSDTCS